MSKCGNMTVDEMLATLNVIGSAERCRQLRAGELIISEPVRSWREEDGVIYFEVTSDGTTGPEWIKRLEKNGNRLTDYAKSVLRSKNFKPTSGVTTEIAVLKGKLFKDSERITSNIRAVAEGRKLQVPNAEVACLIREMFTDKEIEAMGLTWIITMHEPIKVSDGSLDLLGTRRNVDGQWLHAYLGHADHGWDVSNGFAFSVSQVDSRA